MRFMKVIKGLVFAALFAPFLAVAGGSVSEPIYQSRSDTTGYVGLQWLLGKKQTAMPDVVVGVRNTKTSTSNKVSGADLSLTYDFSKKELGSLRLGYLDGKCNTLGTVGLGFDFASGGMLGYLGAVGPYSKVFGQIGGQGLGLGLELNTQDCAKDRRVTVSEDL